MRTFLVHDVPGLSVRGEHAHRECHQFLLCVHGQVSVEVRGSTIEKTWLSEPSMGLYVPPMHWVSLDDFGDDSVLLVLASHPYDANDYIRDLEEFEALRSSVPLHRLSACPASAPNR
jgi:dTDP-4-dehydrorhamnose 3,5-epimerase-like enzyme